jgi:hypothetical protein
MKRHGSLLMFIIIAFSTLASTVLPAGVSSSLKISTATKTPTRTPTATKVPVFGPSSSNHTVPKDINSILEEVVFFGRGGGGGDDSTCKNIKKPTVVSEWFDVEQLEYAWVFACGWKLNKTVSAVLTKPNGTSEYMVNPVMDIFIGGFCRQHLTPQVSIKWTSPTVNNLCALSSVWAALRSREPLCFGIIRKFRFTISAHSKD